MRSFLERQEVLGPNLGPIKLDSVLPTARHRCSISLKGTVLPRCNNAKMGPQTRYTHWCNTASIIKHLI